MKAAIVGASGYTGGEALRLLLGHPEFEVTQITSESFAGKPAWLRHPNLRGLCDLKFSKLADLKPCDLIILGLPHGKSQERIDEFQPMAQIVADLASDFRLSDQELYTKYYGSEHKCPEVSKSFQYSLPELYRANFGEANGFAGAGCIATCAITSLFPLAKAGVLAREDLFIDAKVGSSASGASASPASHHPERAGCLRSFKPTGHRHSAELIENLRTESFSPAVHLSATSTDAVRGILTTAQVFVDPGMSEADIWSVYRDHYNEEPFVRIVKDRRGIYRYPEPKLVSGTNFIDIGFEKEEGSGRVVVMGAIDNLVKGSAGNVVQALNIRLGFPERMGLEFPGLHPC